ncbi:hypothetical protein WMY93_018991 [Mugilogobius chulae]|uniref:Retinoblastoma binding protein 5 n=1 Tax=Mugilogobius chulae TaxID=88201 RepID=A0AAW0NVP1_9GOBI
MALTCTFNRWGTLLAVGCNDGRIVIWDFLTRGIAKIISAHIHPVCSLCWSRDGHKLVSASTDNIVSQWDVLTGDCDQRFRFPSPILKLQCHPRDMDKVLVCPMKSAPVLLTLSDSKHVVLPVDDDSDLNVVAALTGEGNTSTPGTPKESCFLINTADRIIRVYDGREILTCGRDGEPEPSRNYRTWSTGGDAAEDEEVDVTSVDPIVAFCSSDEELEDSRALLYLPIAPEVEDPEENPYGPPPDAQAQTGAQDDPTGDKKQKQSSTEAPAKKKARTTTIELQGVPSDEVHPLLGVKGDSKSKKKTAGRPKGSKGKDREFVRSKTFRDRAVFPLEPVGGAGGSHVSSAGLKGSRAEGVAPEREREREGLRLRSVKLCCCKPAQRERGRAQLSPPLRERGYSCKPAH